MKRLSLFILLVVATGALSVKLSYDPKKGYGYTISGGTAEEVIEADISMRSYLKKGKVPGKATPAPAPAQKK